jgi:hypothetical protein
LLKRPDEKAMLTAPALKVVTDAPDAVKAAPPGRPPRTGP